MRRAPDRAAWYYASEKLRDVYGRMVAQAMDGVLGSTTVPWPEEEMRIADSGNASPCRGLHAHTPLIELEAGPVPRLRDASRAVRRSCIAAAS
jgi:hypothetical protein